MPKRRGKSAASKQQKTPKSRACCVEAGATRPKADDERFYHNKKKLERALNAKIICKEDDAEDQDDATMKKPEKLFNPPSGCSMCKDRTNYTRGMKIVFSAYVL